MLIQIAKSELSAAFDLVRPFGRATTTFLQVKMRWNYEYADAVANYLNKNWSKYIE